MNILVIKETSLGDVLHATGHLRTIKENFPQSKLTVLTAQSSSELLQYNPHVDTLLLFEKDRVKREWFRHLWWCVGHILSLIRLIRTTHFHLAFDLQGGLKSVIFLYGARADRKFVKGRWWFLQQFCQPQLHAIEEMSGVLEMAGLHVRKADMEIRTSSHEVTVIERLVRRINPDKKKMVLVSPFTRWPTKNWGVENFRSMLEQLPNDQDMVVLLTGMKRDEGAMDQLLTNLPSSRRVNLAGQLTLLELAELMKRVHLVVTGDSFPMHLASALHRPVVALFGPTDERLNGPLNSRSVILRSSRECRRCYQRRRCQWDCLKSLDVGLVLREMNRALDHVVEIKDEIVNEEQGERGTSLLKSARGHGPYRKMGERKRNVQ